MDAYDDTPEPIPVEPDGTWTGGGPQSPLESRTADDSSEEDMAVIEEAVDFYHRMVMAGLHVDRAEDIPDGGVDFLGHLSRNADGSPEVTFARLIRHRLPYTPGRKRGLGVSLFLWRRQLHLSTEDGAQATRDTRTRRLGILAALRSR